MAPILWKDDDEPEPGDLIEIFRTGYKHWALYVGRGYIVHVAPPCELAQPSASSLMSVVCENAVIRKDLLWEVAGGDRYRVNNKLDSKYRPLPVNKIVREAERQVGREVPYSLATRNCEHFVTDLRYGCPESQQVREAVGAGVAAAAVIIGVLSVIGYITSRNRQDRNKQ